MLDIQIVRFVVKRPVRNSAPGPDSVKAIVWKKVPPIILHLANLFTICMREGIFPTAWKRATLVLIPKGLTQDLTDAIKARPICLLDEIGKILERIIADRINMWLEDNPEFDLSENQRLSPEQIYGRCADFS